MYIVVPVILKTNRYERLYTQRLGDRLLRLVSREEFIFSLLKIIFFFILIYINGRFIIADDDF